ncbi:MAG TPA: hypothetical protein VKS78_04295 [Roseiarcus sp.]|nr:hypothetical protein [Roseiarcus sp.]
MSTPTVIEHLTSTIEYPSGMREMVIIFERGTVMISAEDKPALAQFLESLIENPDVLIKHLAAQRAKLSPSN